LATSLAGSCGGRMVHCGMSSRGRPMVLLRMSYLASPACHLRTFPQSDAMTRPHSVRHRLQSGSACDISNLVAWLLFACRLPNGRNRRFPVVTRYSGEGRFIEPTAAADLGSRKRSRLQTTIINNRCLLSSRPRPWPDPHSASVCLLLNKRNNIRKRGSNSSARADNTPQVDSKLWQVGSNRSSRTGSNRGCNSRGWRARSQARRLRARSQQRHQG
jgi:hypothetical protein